MRAVLFALPVVLFSTSALAFPGPDSVAVLASADSPESVALADAYAKARAVPARQVCKIAGIPLTDDVSLSDYQTKILTPFEACLTSAGVHDRIEAVLVTRGVPLRVSVPITNGSTIVSLAAALATWESTMQGGDAGGAPLLGQDPGTIVNCGSPCYGASWANPLGALNGPFHAGYTVTKSGVAWKPMLVTMLHGRSQADAQMLLDSATSAEKNGGAKGTFLFMQNTADPARAVLDAEYPNVINQLKALGFTDAQSVPFNTALTGQTLASFFVGTASMGATIEGNTYLPGSLVDNLTSFGAVPQNFATSGESQVSIARWVEKGVGGVHGTVDEPLNNVFPSRLMIVDYAKGAPLAEAYFRWLPYQYWKNLVLGDPMLAPYAKRPVVTITGLADGATQGDAVTITASATDSTGAGIANVTLYVDGVMTATAQGATVSACVKLPASNAQVLAVAQTNTGAGGLAKFPPKGWTEIHATGQSTGAAQCAQNGDNDVVDAGTDAGEGSETSGGCSCRTSTTKSSTPFAAIFAALIFFSRRRTRASRSRRR